jgi:hypothetical protein
MGLFCQLAGVDYIFYFEEVLDCLLKLLIAQGLLKIYKKYSRE